MSDDATWRCDCGTVEIAVRTAPAPGAHIVCHCADCRAFARITGRAATLDPAGGVGLYQTTPDRLSLRRGADRLACLRLTPRGPFRWTASCCGAPMAITPSTRAVPFASLTVQGFADPAPLGRVRAHAFVKSATARVPRPHGSMVGLVAGVVRRGLTARLAGLHTRTPFFDTDARPVAPPATPDAAARAAAYA